MFNSKIFLAEFIGAFALAFVGMSAGIVNAGLVGIALAFGLTHAVLHLAYGRISGAHFNPAITFGAALNGGVKWLTAVFYWVAQFAGAILAAFFLKTLLEPLGATIEGGATVGALNKSQPVMAMVMEALLTFFLVNTVLRVKDEEGGIRLAGWAIGMTYAFANIAGLPFTGASMNPARTLAGAIFAAPSLTSVYTYVIYLFGPLLGATLAVIVSNFLDETDHEDEQEEENDESAENGAKPESS